MRGSLVRIRHAAPPFPGLSGGLRRQRLSPSKQIVSAPVVFRRASVLWLWLVGAHVERIVPAPCQLGLDTRIERSVVSDLVGVFSEKIPSGLFGSVTACALPVGMEDFLADAVIIPSDYADPRVPCALLGVPGLDAGDTVVGHLCESAEQFGVSVFPSEAPSFEREAL